jgi:hypothetical protein
MSNRGRVHIDTFLREIEQVPTCPDTQTEVIQKFLQNIDDLPKKARQDMTEVAKALSQCMKAHPKKANLQHAACACLFWVCQQSLKNKEYMRKPDEFRAIANAFINHKSDEVLHDLACRVMVEILHVEPTCKSDVATSCKIIPQAIQSLRENKAKESFQHICMALLLYLMKMCDAVPEAEKASSIDVVLEGMRAHQKNMLIQGTGCEVLRYVMESNPGGQRDDPAVADRIWRKGAMQAFLCALDTCLLADKCAIVHSVSEFVVVKELEQEDELTFVLEAFATIQYMYMTASKPMPEAGLSVIARMMARHLQNDRVQLHGTCAIMYAMRMCFQNIPHIGQQGIRALLAAMSTHQKDDCLVEVGMSALSIMTCNGKENVYRKMLWEDGGLKVVLRGMEMHKQVASVQAHGLQVFSFVGEEDKDIQETMVRDGCMAFLARSLIDKKSHYASLQLASQCLACLNTCLSSADLPTEIKEQVVRRDKVLDATMHAMSSWKDDHSIQKNGAGVLRNVLTNYNPGIKSHGARACSAAVHALKSCKDKVMSETGIVYTGASVHNLGCSILVLVFDYFKTYHQSSFKDIQDTFVSSGGFDAISVCLNTCCTRYDPTLAGKACQVLLHALADNQANVGLCKQKNMTLALSKTYAHYSRMDSLKGYASEAYAAIAGVTIEEAQSVLEAKKKQHDTPLARNFDDVNGQTQAVMQQFAQMLSGAMAGQGGIPVMGMGGTGGIPVMGMGGTGGIPVMGMGGTGGITVMGMGGTGGIPVTGMGCVMGGGAADIQSVQLHCLPLDSLFKHTSYDAKVSQARASSSPQKPACVEACVMCGKTREQTGLKQLLKCSGCTIAPRYCGAECQKGHWKAHKAECKANKKP